MARLITKCLLAASFGALVSADDCFQGDAVCAAALPGSYCKYWQAPSVCQGVALPCSCGSDSSESTVTAHPPSTTPHSTVGTSPAATTSTNAPSTTTHLRATTTVLPSTTASITVPTEAASTTRGTALPTTSTASASNTSTTSAEPSTTTFPTLETTTTTSVSSTTGSTTTSEVASTTVKPSGDEHRFATYSWSQDYWRKNDDTLVNFGASDMGKLWNSGDVYVNVADQTNYDRIHDQEKLLPWMKQWREVTGNDQRIFLTYGDIEKHDGKRMLAFVDTFQKFLEKSITAEDMAAIAPIGLSFDTEHMEPEDIKKTLLKAQEMKEDVTNKMGYAPGSLFIDFAIEGQKNTLGTQYIMQYADHATMMLYRNAIDGDYKDDLLYRMNYMMTEQCEVCTQPGWENLKAKITIMLEGSCTEGDYCHKLSMCAYDTPTYPNSEGGIEYMWSTLNTLRERTVSDGILTQDQFEHLYDIDGTLYAVHDWEWVRCSYGDDFSKEMGFSNCNNYHSLAAQCRAE